MALSRRAALARLAACTAFGVRPLAGIAVDPSPAGASVAPSPGPGFSQGGPHATHYGRAEGYPTPNRALAVRTGNPWPAKYRAGAFSHLDAIYATRRISRTPTPWLFERTRADLRYEFQGQANSWSDYLARNDVTGLLVAKDDRILFEHYQYARTDSDRLLGQSMTKSLVGLLVGIAISEGAIRSVDDTPDVYLPGLKDTEYGRTPIRALLHMSSGVDFGEERDDSRDLNRLWQDMVLGAGSAHKGTLSSIKQFNHRVAEPGTRFSYASIEPDVLGAVLFHVVRRPLSAYFEEKLWHPIGAEADATWLVDAEGIEVAHFGFSAVLRDYARVGRLLANGGAWGNRQIIPAAWISDTTSVRPSETYLAPGKATPMLGYGYLLWLLPGKRRQFALLGQNGQRICVDPASKLVMVHMALDDSHETSRLWSAIVDQFA